MSRQMIFVSIVLIWVQLCLIEGKLDLKTSDVKLISITTPSPDDRKIVLDLCHKFGVYVLSYRTISAITGRIIVALHQPFLDGLKAKNIKYELKDSKPLVDRIEKQLKLRPKSRDGSFDYVNQYHKLDEIYAELERLSKANPNKVVLSSFGKSFQNNDLKVVKMFGGVLPKNKFVVIECGIHAREWISHAFCMWFINKMLSGSPLLNSYDFVIVPVLNPDGYNFTWEDYLSKEQYEKDPKNIKPWADWLPWARMQRRNRQSFPDIKKLMKPEEQANFADMLKVFPDYGETQCVGIDLNRNFDTKNFGAGASSYICGTTETYCGPGPFTAPETKAYSELLIPIKDKLIAYFSIHSASGLWLYPYGYIFKNETTLAPNDADLRKISELAVSAIKKVDGKDFEFGPSTQTMYTAAGASDDWAYDSLGVKFSFTIEMRPSRKDPGFGDGDGQEFLLDEKEIKPAVEEVFAGIEVVLNELAKGSLNSISGAQKDAPAVESHNDSLSNQYLSSTISIIVALNIWAVLKFIF